MTTSLSTSFPLPEAYRPEDILAFHRRDTQQIAERVTDDELQKGMMWADRPAFLTIRFHPRRADAELVTDGAIPGSGQEAFAAMVWRMLGLAQDVEAFEQRYRTHPQLGPLLANRPGLRVPVAATPFEALTWAVAAQQISLGAAISIRRKLILAAGIRHSRGLLCHPEARQLALLAESDVRLAGFTTTKARTMLALSRLVAENTLPLDEWVKTLPVGEIREGLLAVRGIGPWTINYALLRGFGWLDGSLHGDVAVRRGLQKVLDSPEKISEARAEEWLAEFSPWRALIAAHLWVANSPVGY
jgi:DNA-3-methyladenine glycosylase II